MSSADFLLTIQVNKKLNKHLLLFNFLHLLLGSINAFESISEFDIEFLQRKQSQLINMQIMEKDAFLNFNNGLVRLSSIESKPMKNDSLINQNKNSFKEITKNLTQIEVKNVQFLKDIFDEIDKNQDGYLDKSDLDMYFKSLGLSNFHTLITSWMARIDLDKDNKISMKEFLLSFLPITSLNMKFNDLLNSNINPLHQALGNLRISNPLSIVQSSCDALIAIILNCANTKSAPFVISYSEDLFISKIKSVDGATNVLNAMGFWPNDKLNGLTFRDNIGNDIVEYESFNKLYFFLDQLILFRASLYEKDYPILSQC